MVTQHQDTHAAVFPAYAVRPFKGVMPTIADTAMVDPQATIIGKVVIGENCSIWPQAVLRGDVQTIHIGAGSNIQDGCVLHVTHDHSACPGGMGLHIGKQVTVGHNATLHACTIHDEVLIGMGSTVLDGAVIQSHVLLAANSLVLPGKVLEQGHLYAGNPAQKKRPLSAKERGQFSYMANNYIQLKNTYMETP